jgi:hypothetical protein
MDLLFGQFECLMPYLEGDLSGILDFFQLLPSLKGRFFSVKTDAKDYLSLA